VVDQTEANNIESVDMDVEFEDCSTELVASVTDACHVEDSSDIKDAKQPSKEIERLLVGDTLLVCKNINYTEGGQSDLLLLDSQKIRDQIAGRLIQCHTLITSIRGQPTALCSAVIFL